MICIAEASKLEIPTSKSYKGWLMLCEFSNASKSRLSPEVKVWVRVIVCEDADLRRRPEAEQPGVDTSIEQEPFTEHGKEDSKLVFSLEDAMAASKQGIPGVY